MLKTATCIGIVAIAILSLGQGVLALASPKRCIEIFQAWCRYLNWEVAPINWSKELRNTRILGGLLIVLGVLIAAVLFACPSGRK